MIPREDVAGAYLIVSGHKIYNVYLGLDPLLPPCDCAAALYTDKPCKHRAFALAHPNGTDE